MLGADLIHPDQWAPAQPVAAALACAAGIVLALAQTRALATTAGRSFTIWQQAGLCLAHAVLLAWAVAGHPPFQAATLVAFAAVAFPLAVMDRAQHRLPNRVIFPWAVLLAVLGAADAVTGAGDLAAGMGAGAGASLLLYGSMYAATRGQIGEGDVKLGVCLGATAGAIGLMPWFLAHLAGMSLVALATGRALARGRRGQAVPWGPPLLLGAMVGLLAP